MRRLQRTAVALSAEYHIVVLCFILCLSLFITACEAVLPEKPAVNASLVKTSSLPLRTRGRDIVDSYGNVVHLACVNWYGAHLHQMVANGLDKRSLSDFAASIVELLFNCVRLPFSLEMVHWTGEVPNASDALAANVELQGLTPLEVFDHTVAALTKTGLMVILNVHNSKNGWCCSDSDGDGLWYTAEYPEESFFETVEAMGKRYLSDPLVVGFDLRNEIRTSSLGVPDWGSGRAKSDWSLAASKAGSRLVSVNDNMLVVVSGLNYGMFLCDVPQNPIHIKHQALSRRVVYTSHYYSWYCSNASAFRDVAAHMITTYVIILVVLLVAVPLATGQSSHHRSHEVVRLKRFVEAVGCTSVLLGSLALANHVPSPCRMSTVVYVLSILFILPQCVFSLLLWARFLAVALDLMRDVLLCDRRALPIVPPGAVKPRTVGPSTALEDGGSPIRERDKDREDDQLTDTVVRRATTSRSGAMNHPNFAPNRLRLGAACAIASICLLSMLLAFRAKLLSYETFASELDARFGYLLDSKAGPSEDSASVAPVWLGEFGTDTNDYDWQYFVRYLRERRLDFAYWPINGEKWPHYDGETRRSVGKDETYGLLLQDEKGVRDEWKLLALQDLIRGQKR